MILHNLTREDTALHVKNVGLFHLCRSRLPWRRTKLAFHPLDSDGRWYGVPDRNLADGRKLLHAMITAGTAARAFELLHQAYDENQDKRAGRSSA